MCLPTCIDTLKSDQLFCMSSGCHGKVHNTTELSHPEFWRHIQRKLSEVGMRRILRLSSTLVIFGLLAETASLLWFHPVSLVLFVFIGESLIGIGMLVYLLSLVFVENLK